MLTNRGVLRSFTDAFSAFALTLKVLLQYREAREAEGKKEMAGTELLEAADEERGLGLKRSEDAAGVGSEVVLIMRRLDWI